MKTTKQILQNDAPEKPRAAWRAFEQTKRAIESKETTTLDWEWVMDKKTLQELLDEVGLYQKDNSLTRTPEFHVDEAPELRGWGPVQLELLLDKKAL